tara:strand:- start:13850 stop:14371 length:522 start_codon:yes stop_codon:yes gene_type:complete
MGLDMYLTARHYYGGKWRKKGEWNSKRGHTLSIGGNFAKNSNLNADKVYEISSEVAYWRKANAIHGWFVANCADGVDNCQPAYVTHEQLKNLLELCKEVKRLLDQKKYDTAERLLPPTEGFFFGHNDTSHEWYREEVEETIEQLGKILSNHEDIVSKLEPTDLGVSYWYEASW